MIDVQGPFQFCRRPQGFEILPGDRIADEVRDSASFFLCFFAAFFAVYAYEGDRTVGFVAVFTGLLWGLSALKNRQHGRLSRVPLVVGDSRTITYQGQTVFAGGPIREVRMVLQKNYDEPDSFGVAVIPAAGEPALLPGPFFSGLGPTDGAALAVGLARTLRTRVSRRTPAVPALVAAGSRHGNVDELGADEAF